MRSTFWKTLVLGLVLIGFTAGMRVVQAQAPLTLIQYTSPWKFLTNGSDQGTAWRATNFNDASWPTGNGLLGWEPGTPALYTRASFSTFFSNYVATTATYYFRTHFNFPGNPCGVTLIASNYIDDGAIIYLNGTEMANFRVPVGAAYNIFASGGASDRGSGRCGVIYSSRRRAQAGRQRDCG